MRIELKDEFDLDCRNDVVPVPLVRMYRALKEEMEIGDYIRVITTDPFSVTSFGALAKALQLRDSSGNVVDEIARFISAEEIGDGQFSFVFQKLKEMPQSLINGEATPSAGSASGSGLAA